MQHGIAFQSLIPIRAKPDHASEQTTQLLFGEMYHVFEQKENWIRIKTVFDNYEGC